LKSFAGVCVLAAMLVFCAFAGPAVSQSWSSGATNGLTSVSWSLSGNTYTWILTNNSGHAGDSSPNWDVLVWSLEPFGIHKPTSWTAPSGWIWSDNGGKQQFEVTRSADKYTSSSVAPGASVTFTYTENRSAPLVNSKGMQPRGLAFLAHVAAVKPKTQSRCGKNEWISTTVHGLGNSWYDTSYATDPPQQKTAPEPGGVLILAVAGSWLITCLSRDGRRAASCKTG
jgi:hypothetical protein